MSRLLTEKMTKTLRSERQKRRTENIMGGILGAAGGAGLSLVPAHSLKLQNKETAAETSRDSAEFISKLRAGVSDQEKKDMYRKMWDNDKIFKEQISKRNNLKKGILISSPIIGAGLGVGQSVLRHKLEDRKKEKIKGE